jgi:hypothetical protein
LTWSPDGEEVVAFYLSGNDQSFHAVLGVYALNVGTGEIRQVAEIPDAASAQLAWNPHP